MALHKIPNVYSYKRSYLDKNSDRIDVLFLGNSHIYYGIDPHYTNFRTFNASFVSQSLNFDQAILNKYSNNWSHLKCIVIPVDYFSLFSSLDNSEESWRIKNYSIYFGINSFNKNIWDRTELLTNNFKTNLVRIYSNYIKKDSNISCNELGWGTSYNSKEKNDLNATGKAAAIRHTSSDAGLFKKNISILNDIIDFANARHVKVLFLTSPAYTTYAENLNNNQLMHTINSVVELDKKNENVMYFNLLRDKRFEEKDFYDADHLNEIGTKKFTVIVDSLLTGLSLGNGK